MPVQTAWIRHGEGPSLGYLCHLDRARTPLPAVVVLQEVFGVNAHIEDVTRRFAEAGYAAFAPDLYAERGERPPALAQERMDEILAFISTLSAGVLFNPQARAAALATLPEDAQARIGETQRAMAATVGQLASLVPRLLEATRWLREECEVTRGQKVASVGFCLGGGLSALLACHDPELAGAVIYYGSAPPLELVPNIRCPVLGLYGAEDPHVNPQIPPFEEAMKQAGKRFERVTYEGAGHAFFNDARPSYEVRAARDAFARTLGLLREVLGGSGG